MPKTINLSLVAILLLAAAIRLYSLADHSLWYDEAFSVLFARNDVSTMLSGTVSAIEHPLLYYLSLKTWLSLVGESVWTVRLWSVLTGLASVGMIYLIGRDVFSKQTAYLAALLVALAPFHLQYSQEARMYSLMGFLLLLTTWFYLRGSKPLQASATEEGTIEKSNYLWWLGFGISAGLAMHSQQLAAFYLVPLGLVPLLQRQWRIFGRVVLGASIAALIFAPWLVNLMQQVQQVQQNYWINAPALYQPLLSLGIFFGGYHEFPAQMTLLIYGGALFLTLLLVLQIAFYQRRFRRRSGNDSGKVLPLLWLFAAPLALLWSFSQVIAVYLERALITNMLILMLLLAWFFTRSGLPRLMSYALLGFLGVLFVVGNLAQYQLNSFPYAPVHQAMAYIQDHAQAGDRVVHLNKLTLLPAEVYAPELEQRFLADTAGSPQDTLDPSTQAVLGVHESACIQEAADGAERIWFMTLARAEAEYARLGLRDFAEIQDWLGENFQLEETYRFNDVNVYLYTSHTSEADFVTCAD